jgi:hypothetical protein
MTLHSGCARGWPPTISKGPSPPCLDRASSAARRRISAPQAERKQHSKVSSRPMGQLAKVLFQRFRASGVNPTGAEHGQAAFSRQAIGHRIKRSLARPLKLQSLRFFDSEVVMKTSRECLMGTIPGTPARLRFLTALKSPSHPLHH